MAYVLNFIHQFGGKILNEKEWKGIYNLLKK